MIEYVLNIKSNDIFGHQKDYFNIAKKQLIFNKINF